MKQGAKESEVLVLIQKLQEQINGMDKKVDLLMGRMMATPTLMAQVTKPSDPPREKPMYKIICVDCGKEASLPFKPAADRPVYCKECFSKRRSGKGPIRAEDSRPNMAPTFSPAKPEIKTAPAAKPKKKAAPAKKAVAKKKTVKKK